MVNKVYVVLITQFEEAYGPEYYCEDRFFGVYASRENAMDAILKDCDEGSDDCRRRRGAPWTKSIDDDDDDDNSVTLVNKWDEVVFRYDILEQSLS